MYMLSDMEALPALPTVSPNSILSHSLSSTSDSAATSSEAALRDQLVALKSELRRSKAQTAALESKLASTSRSQSAPFGSSSPSVGTHAAVALANGAGHGKSPASAFGHLRTNGTTPQPPPQSKRMPERPHTAQGFRRRLRSSSPPPPNSPLPPLPPESSTSPRGLRTPQRAPVARSSTSPHQASLSQIPVAVVGSNRALAGGTGRASAPSSPQLGASTSPRLNGHADELLPSPLPPRSASPTRSTSKTSHNPFYGAGSGNFSQDRHAARINSAATSGTGRVIDNLQAELATVRGAHEECKAQLRLSQRAVEHLNRQVADLGDSKERIRLEVETITARLTRKERMLEDVLTRARTAEASLAGAHEVKAEAVKRAKDLEGKTEDAVSRAARAEGEYDALRSGVRGVRDMWAKEVGALRSELEACRSKHERDLAMAREAHSLLLESSKDRDAAAQEIRTAVTAMHTSHATFAAEWSTQLTELTDDVRHSALAGADSHRQAEEVANELRRMRRLMREYAESL